MFKRSTTFIFVVVCVLGVCSASATAATPRPALTLSADAVPTVFSSEAAGYALTVVNSGSEPTEAGKPIVIADTLPPGVTATGIRGAEIEYEPEILPCDLATLTCRYEGSLLPGDTLRVEISASVAAGAASPVTNAATVSGGGVAPVSTAASNAIGTAQESREAPFGFERFSNEVTGVDGSADTQAGDHPFQITNSFLMNTAYQEPAGFTLGGPPEVAGGRDGIEGELKDVIVDEPPGFVGDPQAVPKCPQYAFGHVVNSSIYQCPRDTQVGEITVYGAAGGLLSERRGAKTKNLAPIQVSPIFNVQPDKGYPAEFGFTFSNVTVPIYVNVNTETDYGVRALVEDIPPAGGAVGTTTTFFGTPAANPNLNNAERGLSTPVAFLDNPVDCAAGPQVARIYADTWANPGTWMTGGRITTSAVNSTSTPLLSGPGSSGWASQTATTYPQMTGCDMLQFDPGIEVTPEPSISQGGVPTVQADEPAGFSARVRVPQAPQEAPLLSTPSVKEVQTTLPAGLSVDPSSANGLQGCSPQQIDLGSIEPGNCPPASELGTVSIETPLLEKPLQGQVFLADPGCDPCSSADAADGNMFGLYIQVQGFGVVVKVRGSVRANPSTGQLTATFQNNPQVPFSNLQLKFNGGPRAPLATPQLCGSYTATADLTPWSSPITPDADSEFPFDVDWNGAGEPCPATIPFGPSFEAGTSNPNAGQFSPLTVTLDRQDREQDLAGVQVTTPPGLSGILSGVPLCNEPQASLGTCAEASRIGRITVSAGAGTEPLYEQGSLYLTGPYEGAPFGLSIVVPTTAGPFNLGNVVVRAKITINPNTTALTVTSDPLPQVIDGVPLRIRTTNVTVEGVGGNDKFIFNPTDCAQQHIETTITSAQGAIEHTSVPFAVAGCAGLHFGPTFKVQTSGKTSKADGASLDAKVTYPTGPQSNIASVKVDLPKQLPSRLTTLQKACTAAQFEANPAGCPAASIIGYAKASTPELPVPLTGPAYFVSHGGEAFPSLIIVLQGYGVRINLTAATFISKAGITSSTFKTVPDAPVSSFELYLPEGPHSALTANGNLCTSKLLMPTRFTAQDGAELKQNTKITVTGCPKLKVKAKKRAKAKKASQKGPR